jgi:hypothetical protein
MIKSRMTRWAIHIARMGDENAYNVFVGIPDGEELLGRPKRRWEDDIRLDLREIGWKVVDRM